MDTAAIWYKLPMMFLSHRPMAVPCPILRSSLASDFVKKLLVVDPDVRMTAPQALEHPWIKNHEDACSDCIDEAMVPRMKTRKSRSWRHLTTGRSWKILEDFQKSSGGWWNYFASCKYRLRIWRSLSRRYCLAETACQFCEKCFNFSAKSVIPLKGWLVMIPSTVFKAVRLIPVFQIWGGFSLWFCQEPKFPKVRVGWWNSGRWTSGGRIPDFASTDQKKEPVGRLKLVETYQHNSTHVQLMKRSWPRFVLRHAPQSLTAAGLAWNWWLGLSLHLRGPQPHWGSRHGRNGRNLTISEPWDSVVQWVVDSTHIQRLNCPEKWESGHRFARAQVRDAFMALDTGSTGTIRISDLKQILEESRPWEWVDGFGFTILPLWDVQMISDS